MHYNLGLAHFKDENYDMAVRHFNLCTTHDSKHKHAYNHLAFIFNMHQKWEHTIDICKKAELAMADIDNVPSGLNAADRADFIETEL